MEEGRWKIEEKEKARRAGVSPAGRVQGREKTDQQEDGGEQMEATTSYPTPDTRYPLRKTADGRGKQ